MSLLTPTHLVRLLIVTAPQLLIQELLMTSFHVVLWGFCLSLCSFTTFTCTALCQKTILLFFFKAPTESVLEGMCSSCLEIPQSYIVKRPGVVHCSRKAAFLKEKNAVEQTHQIWHTCVCKCKGDKHTKISAQTS